MYINNEQKIEHQHASFYKIQFADTSEEISLFKMIIMIVLYVRSTYFKGL